MNPPFVILCNADKADQAFAAHSALIRAEREQPALKDNPQWQCLRMDTYEEFCRAFEKVR